MDIVEMQMELIKMYNMNEILMNNHQKLQNICLNIAKRNADIKALDEIQDVLRELKRHTDKFK